MGLAANAQACLPGTCVGSCGAQAGACWCDESCCGFGDCCIDKFDTCGGCDPACAPPPTCDPGDIPANNSCSGAGAPVALGIGDSHTFSGNNECASHDCAALTGGQGETWHAFTLTEDGTVSVSYCDTQAGWLNGYIVFTTACPCGDLTFATNFAQSCPNANFVINWVNLPAGTYYYPVMLDLANGASGDYNVTISVAAGPEPGDGDGECGQTASCGAQAPSGCWCDESCCGFGDCCGCKTEDCGGCTWNVCDVTTPREGECASTGSCGAQAPSGCFCDESCCDFGDCCECKFEDCGGCSHGHECDLGPGPGEGECGSTNSCGSSAPSGCWCDESCCDFGDCCDCKFEDCGGCSHGHTCDIGPGDGECGSTSSCGGQAPSGCWCDESCCDFGDCCDCKFEDCGGCSHGHTCGDVQPGECPAGATGNCCGAHAGVGCEDEACCAAVCACDPFCCNTQWDSFCAGPGFDPDCLCGPGSCGVDNTPECDFCEGVVNPACTPDAGDCCVSNGTPGCDQPECCDAICSADPFCCNTSWDGLCANAAVANPDLCDCGPPPALCPDDPQFDCCEPHPAGNPGCTDPECCELICASDAFCCNTNWDGLCANAAIANCPVCDLPDEGCSLGFWKNHTEHWQNYSPDDLFGDVFGGEVAPTSNCCATQCVPTCGGAGNPTGCDDADCTAAVCAADAFCCNTGWDGLCASAANNTHCVALCSSGVAPSDAFGDATLHEILSSPSGGPNSVTGNNHLNNLGKQTVAALLNAAGVNYAYSEQEVIDAFNAAYAAWSDGGRSSDLEALKDDFDAANNAGCPDFAAADVNMDTSVDIFDLLAVLSDWGSTAGARTDINRDGTVDIFDLLDVLSNWGAAPAQWRPLDIWRPEDGR